MSRHRKKHKIKIGAPPGVLVAPPDAVASEVTLIAYNKDHFTEERVTDPSQIVKATGKDYVTWVNVDGLASVDILEHIGKAFGLHLLALEDSLNIPQRPKFDDYTDHQYVVIRMVTAGSPLVSEQVSIFMGPDFVVTLQEKPGDCLEPVRERLRQGRPRMRAAPPDYLVYAILDAIVDGYYPVLETLGDTLDVLEREIMENPERKHAEKLHDIKRELSRIRRYLWPFRELLSNATRDDTPFFRAETRPFLRDVYDHALQALDYVESFRDMAVGLMDLYLSSVSQRMNEVMKVLTIIATVFIPLSFIAGVYGMNFNPEVSGWNMPELGWRFGYPFALALMGGCAFTMLVYFWRKGWFR